MHITEIHMSVAFTLVACLLLSGTIVFRKAHGMVVHSSLRYLRTASWILAGFSAAFAFI